MAQKAQKLEFNGKSRKARAFALEPYFDSLALEAAIPHGRESVHYQEPLYAGWRLESGPIDAD